MHGEAQEIFVGFLCDWIHLLYLWNSFDQNYFPRGENTKLFVFVFYCYVKEKKGALLWEVRYFPVVKVRSQCGGCRPLGFVQAQIIDVPFPRPCPLNPSSVPIGQFGGISLDIVTTDNVHCPMNLHS